MPLVWTRQSVNNEYENATLLTRDALQKHLGKDGGEEGEP
jgi:hypothetical protein